MTLFFTIYSFESQYILQLRGTPKIQKSKKLLFFFMSIFTIIYQVYGRIFVFFKYFTTAVSWETNNSNGTLVAPCFVLLSDHFVRAVEDRLCRVRARVRSRVLVRVQRLRGREQGSCRGVHLCRVGHRGSLARGGDQSPDRGRGAAGEQGDGAVGAEGCPSARAPEENLPADGGQDRGGGVANRGPGGRSFRENVPLVCVYACVSLVT